MGDRATVNIGLQFGAQTAELAAIDTDRSVTNQLMDNKAVSELPINGRQVFMLMQLSAGTTWNRWFNTCTQLANRTRSNCASADEPVTWMQMTNGYQLRSYDDRFPNIRNMCRSAKSELPVPSRGI